MNYKEYLSKYMVAGKAFFETAQTIFVSLIITAFVYLFIAIPNQVEGASMEESFHNGDLLITNKFIQIMNTIGVANTLSYEYQRGDVIIFQQEGKPDFIKRIIAKEGDTIKFEDEKVYVNGKELDEEYIEDNVITVLPSSYTSFLKEGEERTVPTGKYFVMGDNREHSQDSRFAIVGWVDHTEIKGRVFLRYWPLDQFGIIQRGSYLEK